MLLARLVCSDPDCAEILVTTGASVEQLVALACACGCGLELLALSEAELVVPRRRRPRLTLVPPLPPDGVSAHVHSRAS